MHSAKYDPQARSTLPRAVLADSHIMVAQGIARVLAGTVDVVDLAATGRALAESIERTLPDIVITDINMPHGSGLDVLKATRAVGNQTPFLFLTMHSEKPLVAGTLRDGASGYVLKSCTSEELVRGIACVLAGGIYVSPLVGVKMFRGFDMDRYCLTTKQREVLYLTGRGLRSKQIAAHLSVSVRTIEAHRYALMQIFDVHCALELVRLTTDLGYMVGCAPNEL